MTDVLFPKMSATEGATGVVTTWFVESGDTVTPSTLIAEVAMDKVDAEVYPEKSGVITVLVEEKKEIPPGAVITQDTRPCGTGGAAGGFDHIPAGRASLLHDPDLPHRLDPHDGRALLGRRRVVGLPADLPGAISCGSAKICRTRCASAVAAALSWIMIMAEPVASMSVSIASFSAKWVSRASAVD